MLIDYQYSPHYSTATLNKETQSIKHYFYANDVFPKTKNTFVEKIFVFCFAEIDIRWLLILILLKNYTFRRPLIITAKNDKLVR